MVKNATGGNKSKKQARSSSSAPQQNIRKAKEEGEIYAAVTKIFGGPNCQVMCNDGISRSCIIRNKFKTKGKRDNNITIGSWILVGIRDWEVRSDGTQKCDLLEVYSHSEKDKLKQIEVCDFKHLNNLADSILDNKHNSKDQLEFSSSVNKYDENPNSEEQGSSDEEQGSSSDDEESSIKEDKKQVSKPAQVSNPAQVSKPVSLRELMKPKQTTQNKEDSDWLKVDDI
jgi:initiation factor 1A